MKSYILINILLLLMTFVKMDPPKVEVNYLPKKQWKMSKHDMVDIKLDIERELKSKILQMQMNWKNKQAMEEQMLKSQQYMQPQIIPPTMSFPYNNGNSGYDYNNLPNFNNMNIYPSMANSRQFINAGQYNADIIEKKVDKILAKVSDEKMANFNEKSLGEINSLQEKLKTIKDGKYYKFKQTNNDSSDITFVSNVLSGIKVSNNSNKDNEDNNDSSNLINNIIGKYKAQNTNLEIEAYQKVFKNYNSTIHEVDFNKINEQITDYTQVLDNDKKNLK